MRLPWLRVAHAYPLMLDVTDRLVVIVGGGGVAVRKAKGVLEAGARRVRAVAPTFRDEIPPAVERVRGLYEAAHLAGAGLVFAATDVPAVNDAVVRDARRLGVLVCRADDNEDDPGDFATPALLRDGPLAIAVSAGGAPALAAAIRDEVARHVNPAWGRMAEAMRVLRPRIRDGAGTLTQDRRRAVFRDLATPAALDVLMSGGADAVWRWLVSRYAELS